MAKRFSDTEKWKKQWIRKLPKDYKLLWIYILDDCNHAGIWDVDLEVAELRLGIEVSDANALRYFGDKVVAIDNGVKWFIPGFIDFQYGQLNSNNKLHNSVINLLKKDGVFDGLTSPLQGAKDKEKEKDKDKERDKEKNKVKKRFIKPTIEEIKVFCYERKNNIDAENFFYTNEAKGWVVGKTKTPMQDWKATIRTWENNGFVSKKSGNLTETQQRNLRKMEKFNERSRDVEPAAV